MGEEVWRQVPSAPWLEASSLGRVRTIPFVGQMPNGSLRIYGGSRISIGAKVKKRSNYFIRQLSSRGKNFKVHRLVCEAFHGPAPTGRTLVLHLNEDSLDNSADNLKWGTHKENGSFPSVKEKFRARCKNGWRRGEDNGRSKLTAPDVVAIRSSFRPKTRGEAKRFAKEYGVSLGIIYRVVSGELWKSAQP